MKSIKNTLWGIVFITLGIIFALNALDITNIDIFFDGWWTLFIIIPCFIDLFNDNDKTGNIIGLVIGILLFLSCRGMFSFSIIFKLLVPIILIIIGVSFIFKNTIKEKIPNVKNDEECYATFSYQNIEPNTFKGSDLNAIFGGLKCNLLNSKIEDKSVIKACAVFGGIKIIVPNDLKVVIKSTSIFGGVSNKVNKNKDSKKTLYIEATCLFGGIDINDKNTETD